MTTARLQVGARVAVALVALGAGGVLGCAAVGLHRYGWGLLLTVLATAAVLVAVPGGWWRRLPFAVGFLLVVFWLAQERPEGDLLVSSNTSGYLLLLWAVLVLVGGVVGLRRHPDVHDGDAGRDASIS